MSSKVGMITVMIVFPIYEAESGTNHSPGCAIPSHLFPARMPLLATLPDTDSRRAGEFLHAKMCDFTVRSI